MGLECNVWEYPRPLSIMCSFTEADTGFVERGGERGVLQVWIFHTWTFCNGTYHAVHGQNTGGQNANPCN